MAFPGQAYPLHFPHGLQLDGLSLGRPAAISESKCAPGAEPGEWGECALKLIKLACVVLIGLFVLGGCRTDNELYSTGPAGAGSVLAARPTGSGTATSGTATVSWEAPTTTIQGAALTDLAGYRVYYGLSESDLSQRVELNSVGTQTYVVDNLGPGTWYFAVKAVTSVGVESALSEIVSKTIG